MSISKRSLGAVALAAFLSGKPSPAGAETPFGAEPYGKGLGTAEASSSFRGAGTTVTLGSAGYAKFSLYGDGLWHLRRADPYGWAEFSSDNYVRQFVLGGGAWKDLREDLRVKGGGGLIFGKFKGFDESSTAVLFETGIERDFDVSVLGAEYRLTSGSIVGPTVLRAESQAVQSGRGKKAAGAAAASSIEHFVYNELSGYGKFMLGKMTPGVRLTLGMPSYARSVFDETFSLRIPLSRVLSLTPAVTFEQGPATSVYFSAGVYCLF